MTTKARGSEAEQRRLEELFAESPRVRERARREQLAHEWIAHHGRLAGAFRSHADHHEREQERYQRLLAEETEDTEEA